MRKLRGSWRTTTRLQQDSMTPRAQAAELAEQRSRLAKLQGEEPLLFPE